ncbi:AMP-binding enzyme family protein [Burkholderia pseudomallei]|nr:AMP-binding enzyme family protein [Burkholderia pseudomallei]
MSLNASIAFDSLVKQWVQLLSGRTLVVVPEPVRFDGRRLLDAIGRDRIDVFDCTPSQLALIEGARGPEDEAYPQVTLVGGRGDRRRDVVGVGERIEPDVLQRVWSDGMHGGCDARADHGGACAAHRRAAGERAGLCVERAVEPGAGGRARGALHRRGGCCTRVLEPAGADAGAVHRRSVRGGWAAV